MLLSTFPLWLGRPRHTRQDRGVVMRGKLTQLGIELGIGPVELPDRRLQVIQVDGQADPADVPKRVLQASQERLGILTQHLLGVAFARAAQDHTENPRLGLLAVGAHQHRARAKIHLRFLARLHLQSAVGVPQLAHVAFDRLIRTAKGDLRLQILEDPLGRQASLNLCPQRAS